MSYELKTLLIDETDLSQESKVLDKKEWELRKNGNLLT